jgi:hypothetical protein
LNVGNATLIMVNSTNTRYNFAFMPEYMNQLDVEKLMRCTPLPGDPQFWALPMREFIEHINPPRGTGAGLYLGSF